MTHEEIVEEFLGLEEKAGDFSKDALIINSVRGEAWLCQTLTTYRAQVLEEVKATLTKEHYGISYHTDKCIECSNHDRIKEALAVIEHPTN